MKRFNTTGPCFPDEHYMMPALDRLPGVRELVARGDYFVVHAPRQTGKTTALQALVSEINAKGDMFALYCTLESLQNRSDPMQTNFAIRDLVADNVEMSPFYSPIQGSPELREERGGIGLAVRTVLQNVCRAIGKPVVVFFDEADCLVGDALISFLRQLRDGYVNRRMIPFPKSIALVGMLDVRDYKAQIRPDGQSLGQISQFNIIAEDMLIPNFTESDIAALYAQHTAETGQRFADGVVESVWRWTRGQPWLVNAIANDCVAKIHGNRFDETIAVEDVEAAKEAIIRRRDTHVDSLMERMREPRVRRIVEPLISGQELTVSRNSEDFRYVIDLGLLREDEVKRVVPANPGADGGVPAVLARELRRRQGHHGLPRIRAAPCPDGVSPARHERRWAHQPRNGARNGAARPLRGVPRRAVCDRSKDICQLPGREVVRAVREVP